MLSCRFNEAAGIPRGKLPSALAMTCPRSRCFNEATGIPRGKHLHLFGIPCAPVRFNEAAGIPRGKLAGALSEFDDAPASMRPRVFPAENTQDVIQDHRYRQASMRPRVFPAENPQNGEIPSTHENRHASMRPRVFPAENTDDLSLCRGSGTDALQ